MFFTPARQSTLQSKRHFSRISPECSSLFRNVLACRFWDVL